MTWQQPKFRIKVAVGLSNLVLRHVAEPWCATWIAAAHKRGMEQMIDDALSEIWLEAGGGTWRKISDLPIDGSIEVYTSALPGNGSWSPFTRGHSLFGRNRGVALTRERFQRGATA